MGENSGGHWKNLAEAQKLTQSTKIAGVIEEDIKRNNPLERLPVAQAAGTGLKIEWIREKTLTEAAVVEAAIGQQLSWAEDVDYDEVESTLRMTYIQRKLDKYVEKIYGTYNNYRAQMLLECEKGMKRKVGDRIIYADTTYGGTPPQMDGLHALAAERGNPYLASTDEAGSRLNICQGDEATVGGALSLANLRKLLDAMKAGVDEIWVPGELGIRLDQAYEEKGFTSYVGAMQLTRGYNDIGKPILFFAGVPIVRTDFLEAEQVITGTGLTTNARTKFSTGVKQYSLFAVKFGNVMERDPGICYGYGGTEGAGDFYELTLFPALEDFNAGGIRLVNYGAMLLGSTMCLGRIFDITDAAIVV